MLFLSIADHVLFDMSVTSHLCNAELLHKLIIFTPDLYMSANELTQLYSVKNYDNFLFKSNNIRVLGTQWSKLLDYGTLPFSSLISIALAWY